MIVTHFTQITPPDARSNEIYKRKRANLIGFLFWCIRFHLLFAQLESIYKKAHAAIRSDPSHKKAAAKTGAKKRWTAKRLTHAERTGKVTDRKAAFLAKLKAEADA